MLRCACGFPSCRCWWGECFLWVVPQSHSRQSNSKSCLEGGNPGKSQSITSHQVIKPGCVIPLLNCRKALLAPICQHVEGFWSAWQVHLELNGVLGRRGVTPWVTAERSSSVVGPALSQALGSLVSRGPASPSPSGVFLIPQAVEVLPFIVLY